MYLKCKGFYYQLKDGLQDTGKSWILEFVSQNCCFFFLTSWTDFAKASVGKKDRDVIANFGGDEEGYHSDLCISTLILFITEVLKLFSMA